MWQYETSVVWKGEKEGEAHSGGKAPIEVSTPPEFGGPRNRWTPEDLLSGAVASCIMTTILFHIEKMGIKLQSYISNATLTMSKGAVGLEITGVHVDVSATVESDYDEDRLKEAMGWAEQNCPISESLRCPVEIEAEINVKGNIT